MMSKKRFSGKKRIKVTAIATATVVVLALGGVFAYLQDVSSLVRNAFGTYMTLHVEINETTGSTYDLEPGLYDTKDPVITVTSEFDNYTFLVVTDDSRGCIEYTLAEGWVDITDKVKATPFNEIKASGNSYFVASGDSVDKMSRYNGKIQASGDAIYTGADNQRVYYRVVSGDASANPQYFHVLEGDRIRYVKDTDLENNDPPIALSFQAYAIAKTGYDDAVTKWNELQARKERACATIDEELGRYTPPNSEQITAANNAKRKVEAARTMDAVAAEETAGIDNIRKIWNELQKAKEAAKKAITDEVAKYSDTPSDEMKKAADDAKAAIEAATDTSKVAAAKETGVDKILEQAKKDAKKAIDDTINSLLNPANTDQTNATAEAKTNIDAATSVEDVVAARDAGIEKINSLKGNIVTAGASPQLVHWMEFVRDDVKLSQMTIPGTHDSATKNVSNSAANIGDGLAKAQDWTIPQQMDYGIRAFDLRYVWEDNTFHLYHGWTSTAGKDLFNNFICKDDSGNKLTLDGILRNMQAFLDAHPSETILVNFQREGGTDNQAELAKLKEKYNVLTVTNSNKNSITLGECRGRIVDLSCSIGNAGGDYNDYNAVSSDKIADMQRVFNAAKKQNDPNPELRTVYTTISGRMWEIHDPHGECAMPGAFWDDRPFQITIKEQRDRIYNGFLKDNPFQTYGTDKSYGIVMYDFPSASLIRRTINANNKLQ